ncbi:MAG: bifunctional (p)ppGpp synthetase/guanosine-3',5'-bis(diphosphate) 3'-pyrophosphohydrolase [Lachnospiraceae bacterium]|nr:bifunctional (p)ppGpp synthetase/guanosine-3',5'-bis(diphosphate) 3'-pyrophosphohydrolase [Lachnospiraceae bacterium]
MRSEGINNQDEKQEVIIDDGRIDEIAEFKSPDELYQELISRVLKYHPSSDLSLIEKAYQFAHNAHFDQKRKSREPYIIHPLYVANILAEMELDKESIAAGLLHDVIEDTDLTVEALTDEFGKEVASIVEGMTKLQNIILPPDRDDDKETGRMEIQAENLRKMFLAMAKDIRVILIKLVDRLHNMRTLKHQSPESQQRIARETLEIYAPIAERLGISRIKVELDDLSLKYLEPDAYNDLLSEIKACKSTREKFVQSIVDEITENLKNAGIKANIDGRVKHYFSIYKKMKNQGKSLSDLYDLYAVRILVDTVADCYAALGIIHEVFKPMPGRFKDFISVPRPNSYRSLHTTLFGAGSQPFEIQIRTHEMHKEAEYGITAHWKYKVASDGKKTDTAEEEKLQWLRQILEWQQEMSDNKEFLDSIKDDLNMFSDMVYCFTPAGDVKNLPAGSTPIDFAYLIHSAVGNKMVGARVNGKLETKEYQIKNGDRIEIMTSQNSPGPSRDWLNVVKSAQARNKIQQWFKSQFKVENIVRGKELLGQYCKTRGININDLIKPDYLETVFKKYGFRDWDSVLAAVGHGGVKEGQIINRLLETYEKNHEAKSNEEIAEQLKDNISPAKSERLKSHGGIIVKGVADVAVRFAKCCSPLPGDEIIGFVTRGRGVSVHRNDCINIISLPELERERMIEAEWQQDAESNINEKYIAEIKIFADNRAGLLADISKTMAEKKISLTAVNIRINKQNMAIMDMAFEVKNREELSMIIEKIRGIKSVVDIERTMS